MTMQGIVSKQKIIQFIQLIGPLIGKFKLNDKTEYITDIYMSTPSKNMVSLYQNALNNDTCTLSPDYSKINFQCQTPISINSPNYIPNIILPKNCDKSIQTERNVANQALSPIKLFNQNENDEHTENNSNDLILTRIMNLRRHLKPHN